MRGGGEGWRGPRQAARHLGEPRVLDVTCPAPITCSWLRLRCFHPLHQHLRFGLGVLDVCWSIESERWVQLTGSTEPPLHRPICGSLARSSPSGLAYQRPETLCIEHAYAGLCKAVIAGGWSRLPHSRGSTPARYMKDHAAFLHHRSCACLGGDTQLLPCWGAVAARWMISD